MIKRSFLLPLSDMVLQLPGKVAYGMFYEGEGELQSFFNLKI